MAEATGVGLVAIGRNEGARLTRCLAAVPMGLPVVYVDSASTDGSAEMARAAGATVLALELDRPFTAARARADGVALLTTGHPDLQFVMFVDGDCELEPGWLAAAQGFLTSHSDFAAVCGRRRERFPNASLYNRIADREWNTPIGEAAACGGDAMFRLDAYRAVGGFDPAMIAGEEPELCTRLRGAGWRIMRLDAPMTIHDADMHRFGQWWRRGLRSGFGFAQAWRTTRRRQAGALYGRELGRAWLWGLAVPGASIAGAVLVHPATILAWPALVTAQFLRLRRRHGAGHAVLLVLSHYAAFAGTVRYLWRIMRGGPGATLVYK